MVRAVMSPGWSRFRVIIIVCFLGEEQLGGNENKYL